MGRSGRSYVGFKYFPVDLGLYAAFDLGIFNSFCNQSKISQ